MRLEVELVTTMHGAARALRGMVEAVLRVLLADADPWLRRVLVGDVGVVQETPESSSWVEAIRVLASVVAASGWNIPIVVFAGSAARSEPTMAARSLARSASAWLDVALHDDVGALETLTTVTVRGQRAQRRRRTAGRLEEIPLPPGLSLLDTSIEFTS